MSDKINLKQKKNKMKTKLLKKVRKRYEIRLLEKVAPCNRYYGYTPVLELINKRINHIEKCYHIDEFKDLKTCLINAREDLLKLVRDEWKHVKKYSIYKYKKLWWNEKTQN